MKTKIIGMVVIVAVVAAVLALKFRSQEEAVPPESSSPAAVAPRAETVRATVMLFADPREENANCGCADIIRMARNTEQIPGVTYREFDSRKESRDTEKYGIRVAPTLIVFDAEKAEVARFEGESDAVVRNMKNRLGELGLVRDAAK